MKTKRIPFYQNWQFLRTELDVTPEEVMQRSAEFRQVELPHDWLIYDTGNLYRDGCGWYRKEFVPAPEREPGGRVLIRFDGIYMDSTLYVNRKKVGDWKYGYSTITMDITEQLVSGQNELLVQVRFQSPNSRWYSGAGIYRKVWLKYCPSAYLPFDGTYVTTRPDGEDFVLEAETELEGVLEQGMGCRYTLYEDGQDGQPVQELGFAPEGEQMSGKSCLRVRIPAPKLWSVEQPNCYRLRVALCRDGDSVAVDEEELTIGFRTIELTTDRGLFLNGQPVKIHGVCEHHDFGCLGAAFSTAAMARKIRLLKEMGVNAIRTSHNMPAPELMELADRMGMLVLSEAFDMWERPKTEYDYARFFPDWYEKDVRSWVRRDRNHPSLLLWSIGNEIYDTHADAHGQEITRRLVKAVREHDPKENAQITIGSNYMPWENARACADIVKVAGYNYGEKCYEEQHREHPDWMMYGSETASIVQSRGIYHFPFCESILSEEDEQCSALGNSITSWGASSWENCIADDRDPAYIWGQFLWSGFDYIGEPTPYHTKNSYFGQLDTAGFPKDSYYVYQAEWTDGTQKPMVHLFPYWDFNPGQQVDVRACSNAAAIELFVNGASHGRRKIDHRHGRELVPTWQVVYEPGTILAVAYDEAGKEVARDSHTSFTDSSRLVLSADRNILRADGEDLCFVTVSTEDALGNPVENAADYIKAELTGPGRILGMDNGDSTDPDNYKTTVRKLFSGKLLIVLGSTAEPGNLVLTVSGHAMEPVSLCVKAEKPEHAEQSVPEKSYLEDCCRERKAELPNRIPVRKLELHALLERCLTPKNREQEVEAVLYPADTTDRTLVWKVVNAAGIEINEAKIEKVRKEGGRQVATIRALGDGAFYVRCVACTEERVVLLSQLEFRAEGLGRAYANPYEFVSAGLYSAVIGAVTNGNEKGIATARDGVSGITLSDLDFGEYGSDRITLSIFSFSGDPYPIELWIGKPGEQGRCLTTLQYQKPSIWNVYQEETFQLPERIHGVTELTFLMRSKLHMKGFVFERQEKAFGLLTAGDANAVYGDSFRRDGTSLREIGNNVTLVYERMDFGVQGADRVTICGSTPLAVNTIHVYFTPETGETLHRVVEFVGESTKQTFSLERVCGKGRIELVFLPGSRFDLDSVQFLAPL